jgi:hypothetical protein
MTVYADLLDKTPEQLREMARDCYKRSAESFERCDTDGFLSQWASDQTARVYNYAAQLAENGWTEEFSALFDLDGNFVTDDLRETQYGAAWMIKLPEGGVKWVNPSHAHKAATRRANLEKKGYRVGRISRRVVIATGSGGGFNISVYAMPDKNHPEITVVNADYPGEDY